MNREIPRYSKSELEISPILNRVNSLNFDQRLQSLSRPSEINNENPGQKYSPFVVKHSPNLLGSPPIETHQNENYFYNSSNNSKGSYKIYTPSPNNFGKERLSDRFIPINRGTNLLEKFEMTKLDSNEKNSDSKKDCNNQMGNLGNDTYSNLLENNFFQRKLDFFSSDCETPFVKTNINKETQIKSNIFSFRSEGKRRWSHGVHNSSIGKDNVVKEDSRKINSRPYKILEAPGLLDDFYLNLLDWSSKNDLAVGLRDSVYLWCANKTQCVKLLSYEGEKYVSSVIWNPSGDKVAVGNSEGTVEVWDGNFFLN